MAVRLGRREPCGGRVRLLGAHRLRVRRSRPRAPRPPDRGRPVAPRRAGDARGAGAGRPGVRRRRLRSAPPRRHVRRRWHGRGGSPHGRGCSLRAARRRRLGRLRAARRAAPGGDSDRPGRRACGAHPSGPGARHRSGARARGRGRCRFRSRGAGSGPAPSPGRPPGSARRRARRQLAGGGRSSPRVRARPRGCGRDGPPSPRRRPAHDTAPGNTHARRAAAAVAGSGRRRELDDAAHRGRRGRRPERRRAHRGDRRRGDLPGRGGPQDLRPGGPDGAVRLSPARLGARCRLGGGERVGRWDRPSPASPTAACRWASSGCGPRA